MRLVLDSNVIIAAFATQGLCQNLFEVCIANHTLYVSHELLSEVEQKLRDKVKLPSKSIKEIVSYLKNHAQRAEPKAVPAGSCRDPKDAHIIGLAVSIHCEGVITGDQ